MWMQSHALGSLPVYLVFVWGPWCQEHVSGAGISNYIPQAFDVITYSFLRYLLLATNPQMIAVMWDRYGIANKRLNITVVYGTVDRESFIFLASLHVGTFHHSFMFCLHHWDRLYCRSSQRWHIMIIYWADLKLRYIVRPMSLDSATKLYFRSVVLPKKICIVER